MTIIGLSGRKGAGKDTVFRLLQQTRPDLRVVRVAFADALKEEVAGVLGIPVAEIEADKPRFRLMLQWWGTEWRRAQCVTYWIDRAREKIKAIASAAEPVDIVVVTDVRFPNEAALIRELGGRVVRIVNPTAEQSSDPHPSEVEMDHYPFDGAVWNDGTLAALERAVRAQFTLFYP